MPSFLPRLSLLHLALIAGLASSTRAQYGAKEEWQCGNTETSIDRLLTQHVVPDVFPPNEYLSAYVAPTIMQQADLMAAQRCAAISVARWSSACTGHDRCMELRGATGISSEQCHDAVLSGWRKACDDAYAVPNLGAATNPADAWSQVFAPQSSVNGSTGQNGDIALRIFCQSSCHKMAGAAYVAMKLGTSTFAAKAVVQNDPKPFQGAAGSSPFISEILGWSKTNQKNLKSMWKDEAKTVYEMSVGNYNWIENIDGKNHPFDPDQDHLFGYSFDEGNFTIEARVLKVERNTHFKPSDGNAGLAIRNDTEKGSHFASILTNKYGNRIIFRYRRSDGTVADKVIDLTAKLPRKLSLKRTGNAVTGLYENDAGRMVPIGTGIVSLNRMVKSGLYVDYGMYVWDADSALPEGSAHFDGISKRSKGAVLAPITMLLVD